MEDIYNLVQDRQVQQEKILRAKEASVKIEDEILEKLIEIKHIDMFDINWKRLNRSCGVQEAKRRI